MESIEETTFQQQLHNSPLVQLYDCTNEEPFLAVSKNSLIEYTYIRRSKIK